MQYAGHGQAESRKVIDTGNIASTAVLELLITPWIAAKQLNNLGSLVQEMRQILAWLCRSLSMMSATGSRLNSLKQ